MSTYDWLIEKKKEIHKLVSLEQSCMLVPFALTWYEIFISVLAITVNENQKGKERNRVGNVKHHEI